VTDGSILFVHAHPDDESIFTAGASLTMAHRGRRVVLVTATNGRLGLDAHVRAGNDPRHDAEWVVRTRAAELAVASALVGVDRLVTLGYDDSGLPGWPVRPGHPRFIDVDTASVAATLAALIDGERAEVVVTYDEHGYYGHPDHVHCHDATAAAVRASQTVQRLYYPVTPRAVLAAFTARAASLGVHLPLWVLDAAVVDDDDVDVTVDATAYAPTKRAAIAAHASQVDNADLVTLSDELFADLFGREFYRLGWSRDRTPESLNDLFGGLN
jgi:LmbE family N-acetylglucosaminyl deacetylase